jgi:hypothetical protein
MSRREVLGERQVAAPLMAQRSAHGTLRLAHRRFQPGAGVGIQLAGLRLSGKPQRPTQRQLGHEAPVLGFALIAPAASRPGQHGAVRRQRGRQVAPCGHTSTVGQRFLRLVLRDDQEEERRFPLPRRGRGSAAGPPPGGGSAVLSSSGSEQKIALVMAGALAAVLAGSGCGPLGSAHSAPAGPRRTSTRAGGHGGWRASGRARSALSRPSPAPPRGNWRLRSRSSGDTGVRLGGAALVRDGAAWSVADDADRAGSRGDYGPR